MRPVLAVVHWPRGGLGMAGAALRAADAPILVHNPLGPDPLPSIDELSAIVSFGGQMSATELSRYPFLVDEIDLMRDGLRTGTPIFGICLGSQLLSIAAGGSVHKMERPCIDWPPMDWQPAVDDDPLFNGMPPDLQIVKWHNDRIDLPPSATVLADTDTPGHAIFKVGERAWGSQMHLEVTPDVMYEQWLTDPVEQDEMDRADIDPDAFADLCRQFLPAQVTAMSLVFERFAKLVTSSTSD